MSCSELSAGALEPLAGTATRARRWLLLEVPGAWGRDALADTALPDGVAERAAAWAEEEPGSRVLLVRRPGAGSAAPAVFVAAAQEQGGTLRRVPVEALEDVAGADLDAGEPVRHPLFLVCAHGRRDPCCARLGRPLFDALETVAPPGGVWQSSHQGGHRFAGNVLVLPHAVQLGRVRPVDAAHVAASIGAGAVPLAFYRGRTLHEPAVQAAEATLRTWLAVPGLGAIAYLGPREDGAHAFRTPHGDVAAHVDEEAGPALPQSCGADHEPSSRFRVRLA